MSKNKRMIYIQPDNIEFYDKLENKSEFINDSLKLARLGGVDNLKVTEIAEDTGNERVGLEAYDALEAMRKRDQKILKEYRKKNGLYDPVKSPGE